MHRCVGRLVADRTVADSILPPIENWNSAVLVVWLGVVLWILRRV